MVVKLKSLRFLKKRFELRKKTENSDFNIGGMTQIFQVDVEADRTTQFEESVDVTWKFRALLEMIKNEKKIPNKKVC